MSNNKRNCHESGLAGKMSTSEHCNPAENEIKENPVMYTLVVTVTCK